MVLTLIVYTGSFNKPFSEHDNEKKSEREKEEKKNQEQIVFYGIKTTKHYVDDGDDNNTAKYSRLFVRLLVIHGHFLLLFFF